MINNNGAVIRKLSNRSLRHNRMRNLFAVAAIALTGALFTAVFSLTGGAAQIAQESTMREVGTRAHAGVKGVTKEQYEKVAADPLVVRSYYNIYIGSADNIRKWLAELRYLPEEAALSDMFITLEEGHLPRAEQEIVVNTFVFDELQLPCALGVKIPVEFSFLGETVRQEFVVSGWYRGDYMSHASELFVSEQYWEKLKGGRTDADFLAWRGLHPEDQNVGLRTGSFYFADDSDLEEKMRTAIINAGYEPETEVKYGVNWAYMSSRLASVDPLTLLLLGSAVLVILATGYLIIYNIFRISVVNEIRYYGLLKTIGTTKRQIHRLVRRQALLLSAVGIPVGLAVGYGIGGWALPLIVSFNSYAEGTETALRFEPWILVFGAAFSLLTVLISSRKPAFLAGSVSPVEAVRYAEAGRHKISAVVVVALSFSMILLTIIMTGIGSFRIEQYMEQRIAGDYMLGNVDLTSSVPVSGEITIEPELLAVADQQSGIEAREEMWVRYGAYLQPDETARGRLRQLEAAGRLRQDSHSEAQLTALLQGEGQMGGFCYGYTEGLLPYLTVLEGELDLQKFQTGDYVLLTPILGDEWLSSGEHIWHPGERVCIGTFTEDSSMREIAGADGETASVVYENLMEKEYEVMAIVEIPDSMNLHRHTANGCDVVLPFPEAERARTLQQMAQTQPGWERFMVAYTVAEEEQAAFEAAVRAYTDSHAMAGYRSKASLQRELADMVNAITVIGIAFAAVVALIGILNFINAVATQIISRRREFAVLQSIGMTHGQLQGMLVREGLRYIVIAGGVSLVAGSLLAYLIMQALNNVVLFFEYRFQMLSFVIMLPVLALVAVLTPLIAYRQLRKKSIVERLRESE